ncbi:MAG: HAMP domain-containing histidine kinase [Oscillospiraceae bacterium]|nr:HAMP domain-containing histidine kinase [Oscillospiraceae bacterium]
MFGKNTPFISLGKNWTVTDAHRDIKEKYKSLLAPGFFTSLLDGYTADYFDTPVVLSAPGTDLAGIRLVFAKDDDVVKCYPVRSEIYGDTGRRNVHYQMREPITGIFALMPVLTDNINKGDSVKAISTVEKINRQSYKLLKNVTNMTLVSKIMSGNLPEAAVLNLSSLVDNLAVSVKTVEKNVDISVFTDKDIFVNGNMQLLTTGILNLISNSINFCSEEQIKIEIKLTKEKDRAIFSYSDNSKGIKDEYLQQVFKPYFSKDPFADGESDPSMGLGLFITKSAFEQTGGRIMLTSSFGNGVKYNISIPLVKDTDIVIESSATDFLLNRYSELFVQLCESCLLPELK